MFTDDSIELFNPMQLPVPLGGLDLTDNPAGWPDRSAIAPLSFIAARGFALLRADGGRANRADQVAFKLSSAHEMIALSDSDGNEIDKVIYYSPLPDQSQGRSPDGTPHVVTFETPTLGASNVRPTIGDLERHAPLGSLIYSASADSTIYSFDEVHRFEIDVEARQMVAVVVEPSSTLRPTLTLLDPAGNTLDTATAAIAGDAVFVQSAVALNEGSYTVAVRGAGGSTGAYSIRLIRGAQVEAESYGGAGNDGRDTAQDLDGGFLSLNPTTAQRAAVLGTFSQRTISTSDPTSPTDTANADQRPDQAESDTNGSQRDEDWYHFTLGDGQSITLAVTTDGLGDARLELYDSSANLLAVGVPAKNVDQALNNFVDMTTDGSSETYFVRVMSDGTTAYSLLLVRDGDFDIDRSDGSGDEAQDITGNGIVLGAVTPRPPTSEDSISGWESMRTMRRDGEGFEWWIGFEANIEGDTDKAYDNGFLHSGFLKLYSSAHLEQNDAELVFGPTTIGDVQVTRKIYVSPNEGFARYLEIVTNTSASAVEYDLNIETDLGSNARTRLIGSSIDDGLWDARDDWMITDDDVDGGGTPALLHVVADGNAMRPASAELTGDRMHFRYLLKLAPSETQIVMHFAAQNVDQAAAFAKAPLLAALKLDTLAGVSQEESEQIVNFRLDDLDSYRFGAREGDLLTIDISLPDVEANRPVNLLQPAIELFDPNGELVVSGSSDPVPHTATLSGTYVVRVRAEEDTSGDYILTVTGATGSPPPFRVVTTVPPDGTPWPVASAELRIHLSDQVLLTSLEASDLTVDGRPATAVTVVDGDTLEFTFPSLAEGPHDVTIAAGALEDVRGEPIETFASQLIVDTTAPRIIDVSIQEDAMVPAGVPLEVAVRFDETLNTSALDPADVRLTNENGGTYPASGLRYDPVTSTVTVEFPPLYEGRYTLTLLSGDGRFEDPAGNDLDGESSRWPIPPNRSGDGTAGGDFVVHFQTDVTTAPFPLPLAMIRPAGSLVYSTRTAAAIGEADDTDRFTIDLDDSQTITVVLKSDASLQAIVTLTDPDGTPIGQAAAATAGESAVIQAIPTNGPGTYIVSVNSVDGSTGSYSVRLIVGAAMEEEGAGEVSNSEPAGAEDLDGTFMPLGVGAATRGAVLGRLAVDDNDWYRFSLDDGQPVTLALTTSLSRDARLELYDGGANLLARGVPAVNVNQVVNNFTDTTTNGLPDTYFARVTDGTTGYSLLLIKDADFDTPSADDAQQKVQAFPTSGIVLGALTADGAGADADRYRFNVNAGDTLTV
ncbi:MAG: hypothetical protein ACC645_15855, partial [Pirellulales bacterium]